MDLSTSSSLGMVSHLDLESTGTTQTAARFANGPGLLPLILFDNAATGCPIRSLHVASLEDRMTTFER